MAQFPPPPFAAGFPDDPELAAAVEAFARGDYGTARARAARLVESSPADDVRRAARVLVTRTQPDPLAVWLLALTAALLVVVGGWWLVHGKPPATERGVVPAPSAR